jgi:arylsulfatase A-like enzyme
LADDSLVYTRAITPSSWTLPAHASLFTGKFTSSHGARKDPNGPLYLTDAILGPKKWRVHRARGLASDELTLAEILKKTGYTTGAVVGGPWLKRIFGLDTGFDFYDDAEIGTLNGRLARQVTASAIKWVEKLKRKEFFLFLNYFDPHFPYMPPEGFAHAFLPEDTQLGGRELSIKEVNALYDAEVRYMDYYIGKFLDRLRADGLYDNSFIIVTADHGELFGEHGRFDHGRSLYQEELQVPLLMKYPSQEVSPNRTNVRVQLNDIFAMILERVGERIPEGIQAGIPPEIGHPVLAEVYPLPTISQEGNWRAIFEGDFKFIWNSKGQHQLFNLRKDSTESVNLATRHSEQVARMFAKMNAYLAKLPEPGPLSPAQALDESTKKALKSLGYVN